MCARACVRVCVYKKKVGDMCVYLCMCVCVCVYVCMCVCVCGRRRRGGDGEGNCLIGFVCCSPPLPISALFEYKDKTNTAKALEGLTGIQLGEAKVPTSLARSLSHSLTHSLTHLLTHFLTHSLTQSLTSLHHPSNHRLT